MDKIENWSAIFPAVSKKEWLQRLERDLKGKPLSDLQWQLEETITLDPFYHPEDIDRQAAPVSGRRSSNDWEIGEYISVSKIGEANRQALDALAGGAEALLFRLRHELTEKELEALLQGIGTQYVSIHFGQYYPGKAPKQLLFRYYHYLAGQDRAAGTVKGSIDFDPFLDWSEPPLDTLADAIGFCSEEMPQFRILEINGSRFQAGPEYTTRELAYTIAKGSEYLAQMAERGIEPAVVNRHLQFSMAVNTSYFVEIAKLRALKILWANVLKAYKVDPDDQPLLVVHFAPETQDVDPNTNMIKGTTQAMAAVIGGADRLFVLPSDAVLEKESYAFNRRIARNVQHLLKMESHLDWVVDPAAGSFYVEKLTEKLAEEAWTKFQKIEAEGGFLRSK